MTRHSTLTPEERKKRIGTFLNVVSIALRKSVLPAEAVVPYQSQAQRLLLAYPALQGVTRRVSVCGERILKDNRLEDRAAMMLLSASSIEFFASRPAKWPPQVRDSDVQTEAEIISAVEAVALGAVKALSEQRPDVLAYSMAKQRGKYLPEAEMVPVVEAPAAEELPAKPQETRTETYPLRARHREWLANRKMVINELCAPKQQDGADPLAHKRQKVCTYVQTMIDGVMFEVGAAASVDPALYSKVQDAIVGQMNSSQMKRRAASLRVDLENPATAERLRIAYLGRALDLAVGKDMYPDALLRNASTRFVAAYATTLIVDGLRKDDTLLASLFPRKSRAFTLSLD